MPLLKGLIQFEEDANTAKEHVHPQPKTAIQDVKLKRLLDKKTNSSYEEDSSEEERKVSNLIGF